MSMLCSGNTHTGKKQPLNYRGTPFHNEGALAAVWVEIAWKSEMSTATEYTRFGATAYTTFMETGNMKSGATVSMILTETGNMKSEAIVSMTLMEAGNTKFGVTVSMTPTVLGWLLNGRI